MRKSGYVLEVNNQYPENLHNFQNELPFLQERMKIEKTEKIVANLHDKNEYVIHLINLKQALNQGLVLKKTHRTIKFNKKVWLKSCIEMKTELRKKQNMILKKLLFKLTNKNHLMLQAVD